MNELKIGRTYKDLGNLSAVEGWASVGLRCDVCMVEWVGCSGQAACPQCGNHDDWDRLMEARGYYKRETPKMKYVAYQTWANPSWQSGPRYSERIYGVGNTPEEAIHNARYEERNGETWQKAHCPDTSDLSTRRADPGDVALST